MTSETNTLALSYTHGTSTLTPASLKIPKQTYLFGHPIAHSYAPLLHSTLFKEMKVPWTYSLHESLDNTTFLPLLKSPEFIGTAVTMPHKVTFISECDELTEEATAIGAINTIFLRTDERTGRKKFVGTNTDSIGIRESFLQNFPGIVEKTRGKAGMVLGGGGAARTAIYALWKWFGVSKIYLVNRLKSEIDSIITSFQGVIDIELIFLSSLPQAMAAESPGIIVGTVPDFEPKEEGELIAREIVEEILGKENKGFVLEMCYHPNPITQFFKLCESNGWNVLPGTEAMIHQGVAQQVLWMEKPFEEFDKAVEKAKVVVREALRVATA